MRGETEVARKYFTDLLRESTDIARGVRAVDLEGPQVAASAAGQEKL